VHYRKSKVDIDFERLRIENAYSKTKRLDSRVKTWRHEFIRDSLSM
jgi:hypothetical protein